MKKILAGILISLMVCSNGFSADRATLQSGSGEELGTASNPIKVSLTGGGSGAPTDATYITQTANGSLSAEQALGDLASGILKNTTTTGVLSIATAGTDYVVPAGNVATATALAANGTNCSAGNYPLGVDASGNAESCTAIGAGSGDIESVWSVTTGAVTTPVIGTGERLDGGTATTDGTNEGILLPRGTAITAATTDGQIAYNTTNDYFGIGNGTSNIPMGMFMFSASQTNSADPWRKDAFGGGTVAALEGNRTGHALKCGFFYCKTAVAPGAGNSWTCYFNDDNTGAHSCTISDTNLSCTDSTVISVAAESILDFQISESGTATSTQGMSVSNFCWRA